MEREQQDQHQHQNDNNGESERAQQREQRHRSASASSSSRRGGQDVAYDNDGLPREDDDMPLFSRVIILHPRRAARREVHDAFAPFGHIQSLYMILDSQRNMPKGNF